MSNIYIQEPPTNGKVLLITTVGDIDIELWSKECPKACKNFVQLCMEGYYDKTIFHRVVKGFIVQGGDPTGTGDGGESIYGSPFKDEFHSRLRFNRRGLVGVVNAGKNDNGSQFFFTLDACPELQNKNTLFGKVTGKTLYNMLKLGEGLIEKEKPKYPHQILHTQILCNPFSDIVPRRNKENEEKEVKKMKYSGTNLLSFGDEAEILEKESYVASQHFSSRGKSSHDIANDPLLSSVPAVEFSEKDLEDRELEGNEDSQIPMNSKLMDKNEDDQVLEDKILVRDNLDHSSDEENEKAAKLKKLQEEVRELKKYLRKSKQKDTNQDELDNNQGNDEDDPIWGQYNKEIAVYRRRKQLQKAKGPSREQITLELLSRFSNKLLFAKEKCANNNEDNQIDDENELNDETDVPITDSWLTHKLVFDHVEPVLAKDANTKGDDWFEIYDPRNPINKRRRGEIPDLDKKDDWYESYTMSKRKKENSELDSKEEPLEIKLKD